MYIKTHIFIYYTKNNNLKSQYGWNYLSTYKQTILNKVGK